MLVSENMGSPLLTQSEWDEVAKAAECGMSDDDLAAEFGIPKNTIRQRRFADKKKGKPWLTPKELSLAAEIEELKAKSKVAGNGLTSLTDGPSALGIASAKLAKLKEEAPLFIAERVFELIQNSLNGGLLTAPKSWKELSSATSILGAQIGQNKSAAPNVTIGMKWGSKPPTGEGPIVVVKTESA